MIEDTNMPVPGNGVHEARAALCFCLTLICVTSASAANSDMDPSKRDAGKSAARDNEFLELWRKALKTGNATQKREALAALAERAPAKLNVVPDILSCARSGDSSLLLPSIKALGACGPAAAEAVPLLKKHAAGSGKTQRAAIEALGRIGPKAREAVPVLIPLLSGHASGPRLRAAEALARIGGKGLEHLLRHIEETRKKGQHSLYRKELRTLRFAGDEARTWLHRQLEAARKARATDAITDIIYVLAESEKVEQGVILDLTEMVVRWEPGVSPIAAYALLKLAPERIKPRVTALIPQLVSDLGKQRWGQSCAAGDALILIGDKSIPALLTAVQSDDSRQCNFAGRVLGRMGDKARFAVPEMIRLLKGGNSRARNSLMLALAEMGEPAKDAIPVLMSYAEDPNCGTIAISALGQFGPLAKEALPLLKRILRNGKPLSRSYAEGAITQITGK